MCLVSERNAMTEQVRKELDAFDLLMQDHREVESLFREFEYLQQDRKNTGRVIADACAELKIHDTLETEIFYAALDEAADDEAIDGLLNKAEVDHDAILDLIENIEQTPADDKRREACFTRLAERVKHHVLAEEAELFPLVKKLKRLDLESITAAMKKRKVELLAEMGIAEADEETV
jgi:hemerythrin superfamily protein